MVAVAKSTWSDNGKRQAQSDEVVADDALSA